MENSKFFEREIGLIKNEHFREFITYYLDHACPAYFWKIGASSSGKFHPPFAQGAGGLVRHTKAVVMFAEELLRMSSYAYMQEDFKDYVIMACIVHDTCKYGIEEYNKDEYKNHVVNAAKFVGQIWNEFFREPASEFFLSAIRCHMGQWSEKENRPFTSIDRCVHQADYFASRSFIDIPKVTEEWHAVALEMGEEA